MTWPKRFLERLWINHQAEKSLSQVVSLYKPDIIHTNVGVLRVGYYVAKKYHIPHVWHIRETYKTYPTVLYQRILLNKNCYNIAITKAVKEYFCLSERNSRVVYDGVFSQDYSFETPQEKSDYFLYVGRVIAFKGADWAVDAFLQIANRYPSTELWMVGDESSQFAAELKERVSDSDASCRIKFLGPRNDIYSLIRRAQAVLVPSVREGFGFVPVEAMLNRTIVIGRDTAGVKEQFDNGLKYSGAEIALRCNTIGDMARHIEDVCHNGQSFYGDMIDRAQKVVRNMYTIENNVNQILDIYNQFVIK